VKAVVLTGAGGNFCSGGDVHEIIGPLVAMDMPELLEFTRMTGDLVLAMRRCTQPVIAAVDGVCAGAGAILAMASDLRLGTPKTKTAFLFTRVGLAGCDMGACSILPRLIGQGRAAELLYTGRAMSADEGLAWGFFNRVVASDAVLAQAQALAADLAAGPTFAQLGLATGAITPAQFAFYQSLPNAGKDAFIKNVLDGVISGYGYSPTGIQDPSINATFTVGGPVAAHHYGWTEFDIDPQSKGLTLTTYGVDWYTPAEAATNPQAIIARPITVRQKIVVTPRAGACAEDLNRDGTVNSADFAQLLGAWGVCSGSCPSDLTGDGMVDGSDLTRLLVHWGDC
jgi:enoyl-CoA hydratase/carnithine racemase